MTKHFLKEKFILTSLTSCIKQVPLEDATEVDWLFTVLMGEDVEPRKKFIQAHAKEVMNLVYKMLFSKKQILRTSILLFSSFLYPKLPTSE